ncbi:DUF6776 family protein [Acinetobacter puyangensis]|uniref:DUF6776 family protein n=1 Tax=Acinetobacter puyangensis TaxID=1096779 RepID=UPI003A4DBE64
MKNTEQSEQIPVLEQRSKQSFVKSNYPLVIAAVLLAGGGLGLGYAVGHKQGLTVVGFDADAEELSEIVNKQKKSLDAVSVALNTATQERDVAIGNAKELNVALNTAKQDKRQAESLSATYREKLRERGGLSLSIQNLAIRPLPSNAYEYVLDLVQVSPNRRRAAGKVEIRLVQNSEILTVPLDSANYNFDDFERLTGRWTMPSGFTPQYIEVHLSGAGNPVIQRFAWQRGKDTIESPAFLSEIPQAEANAK